MLMGKLLHINAAPRGEESRTLQVSEVFLEAFQKGHPNWTIDELNLAKEKIPSLSMKQVNGKYLLLSGKELFGEYKDAWEEIIAHIERFLSADIYLVSTPMWNFSIPYLLKHYIDVIVQPKFLFRYNKDGSVEGLAKNKKMVVIASRGGDYTTKETEPLDFQEPYLKAIFGFVGITDISCIKAQPMDMGKEKREERLSQAKKEALALAHKLESFQKAM